MDAAATPPPSAVIQICGPLAGMTGGDLCSANIAACLQANVGATIRHDACPPAIARLPIGYTLRGFLANLLNLRLRFAPRTVLLVDHGEVLNLFLALHVWRWLWGVRIVYTAYHLEFNIRAGFARWLRRHIERLGLRAADAVAAISESSRGQMRELVRPGVPVEIVPVVTKHWGRPAPPERPASGPDEPCRFFFAGIVQRRKGLEYALRALRGLPAPGRVEFRIAGEFAAESEYGQELQALARELPEGQVRFLGRIDEAQLEQELATADALLFPSLWEGYGMAVLEAMWHGLPAIAFDAGAVTELIVPGETGWLVPLRDVERLRAALAECAADPARRRRLGLNGWKRASLVCDPAGPGPAVLRLVRGMLEPANAPSLSL